MKSSEAPSLQSSSETDGHEAHVSVAVSHHVSYVGGTTTPTAIDACEPSPCANLVSSNLAFPRLCPARLQG